MKTITQTQFFQVVALLTVAAQHHNAIQSISTAINDTLGLPANDWGLQIDALWTGDTDARGLLERLEITVQQPAEVEQPTETVAT